MRVTQAAPHTPPVFLHLSGQKRNTSLTYSNSLKELLQRKISTLEQQLHHSNAALGGPERHGDDHGHGDDKEHHDDHRSDVHDSGHEEGGDDDDHTGHRDKSHDVDHHEGDGDHGNEAAGHSLVSHTEYRTPGKTGFHSSQLDSMLNQLHLAGTRARTFVTETAIFGPPAQKPTDRKRRFSPSSFQQEEATESRRLPDQLPHEKQPHVRARDEVAAAGDLRAHLVCLDPARRGARHGDAIFLLGARTGQRAGAHRMGQQPHGAAGQ